MLLYLTDVEEGGETTFLLEGKDGLDRLRNIDYTKCDTGIQVSVGGRRGEHGYLRAMESTQPPPAWPR